jgi:hypothetical protein
LGDAQTVFPASKPTPAVGYVAGSCLFSLKPRGSNADVTPPTCKARFWISDHWIHFVAIEPEPQDATAIKKAMPSIVAAPLVQAIVHRRNDFYRAGQDLKGDRDCLQFLWHEKLQPMSASFINTVVSSLDSPE